MQDLLYRAQNYINYEEKMLGEKSEKAKITPKKDERAREERGRRIPRGGYTEYTPLNTSREKILQDCLNTEYADAGIRPPRETRENSRTDTSKFCRYHKSAGHDTEDCIQLKDAIEDLIKLGKLSRYTKEDNHRGYEKRKYDPPRRNPRRSESPKRKRSPKRESPPKKRVKMNEDKGEDINEEGRDICKKPFVAAITGGLTKSLSSPTTNKQKGKKT
ncbi:hypothetical protein A2U01_0002340 [Trifolium medium]|uniref:Gag-pol polyprotein n=1 Tax=Trifolium medium TaxID=97028 RepID=A0A392M2L6_9FABA|nr:hypothetical protein [Trifolium medium]